MKKVIITLAIVLLSSIFAGTVFGVTGTVNTDELNLRDGASTTGTNVLTKIHKNSQLNILEEKGDWYKVKFKNYEGYVSKQYVDKKQDNNTNTTSNENQTDNSEIKVSENAIVYVLPLINSSKISEIKKDEKVIIISEVGNWKYIQTDYISGWVLASKINGSLKDQNSKVNQNDDNIVNTTSENNISNNTENITTENTTSGNISDEIKNTITIEDASNENEVSETNSTDNNSVVYPMTLYVNVEAVNIRENPNTSSEINDSADKNTSVKVTGESGDWYKVEVNGVKGYIMKKYLSKNKQ